MSEAYKHLLEAKQLRDLQVNAVFNTIIIK